MTEDEEFELLEQRQRLQSIRLEDDYFEAVLAAQQFVEGTAKEDLAIMTLRKAFELGFRQGRM